MSEELYNSRDYCALAEELESLKKNYAKLEAQVVILKGMNFDFAGSLFKANKRIAELETENDQLTAHDATERQDDKWIQEVQK